MRARLAKAVRTRFESRMREKFPKFSLLGRKVGAPHFMCQLHASFAIYLDLMLAPKRDSFVVSVGHGAPGALPTRYPLRGIDYSLSNPCLIRMSELTTHPFRDVWWPVDPKDPLENPAYFFEPPTDEAECLERVPRLIDEALAQVESHAIPFWSEVAKRHGILLDLSKVLAEDGTK